ncbi:MAG: GMC family oxidoreductase, partial [Acidobacteria bacterium]
MLEAGPALDPGKDFKEHLWPYELTHRGAGIAGMYYNLPYLSEFSAPNAFFTIRGEPYTTAPDSKFMWLRSRIVGGRTNHWARIALRFAEVDFKGRSADG